MTENPSSGTAYKRKALPAYLVLDTSGSMEPYEALLNKTLLSIYDTLYVSPQVSEFVHLSVLSFSTMPHVVTPMTDIEELESLPSVTCSGLTNFGPMFHLLRGRIESDLLMLRDAGSQVVRPVVFLLTDGIPTDEPDDAWLADYQELRDPAWKPRPQFITYGFGQASEAVLKRISTAAAYLAEDASEEATAAALTGALTSMLNSLVASAKSRRLEIPQAVKGYRSVPLDDVEF
ncbi:vWA domain-containing protein [Streptomyces chattanoogensis]|uniref:vWA domain-containing protein n=1 Tax=Streptomyces chattanoogensis TaxID=66876 RepID=UPI0036A5641B